MIYYKVNKAIIIKKGGEDDGQLQEREFLRTRKSACGEERVLQARVPLPGGKIEGVEIRRSQSKERDGA